MPTREEMIAALREEAPPRKPTREEMIAALRGNSDPKYGEASTALQGFGQAGSFGYLPELQAAATKPLQSLYETFTGEDLGEDVPYSDRLKSFRGRDVQMQEERPGTYLAGQVGGAIASAPLVGGKALQGASALQKIGQAAKIGAISGAAYNPHAGETGSDLSPMLAERGGNAVAGGIIGGGVQGLLSAGSGLLGLLPKATAILDDATSTPQMKKNAAEIVQAAKTLKTEATPGMLVDGQFVGGLESSLEQSPSLAAQGVQKAVGNVRKATTGAADDLLKESSSLSPFEAGQKVKGEMLGKIGEDLAPHQMAFDDLRSATKDIELFPKGSVGRDSRKIIARNILNIPEVSALPSSPWASEAKQFADAVANAKTTQDITIIRQTVGKEFGDATSTRRYVLGQIYDKLGKLEENSIKRGAIASASTKGEGNKVASEMLGQMRGAKKGYAKIAGDLREFGDVAGIRGSKDPTQFVKAIDKMKSEDLIKKLSNTNDVRMLTSLKTQFPEQFEVVRQRKLAEIAQKSAGKRGVDIAKFMNATKSLDKEAKVLLFGSPENVERYEAIKVLWKASPEKMGPSGTPQGEMFKSLLNPIFQVQELGRRGLYEALKTPQGQAKLSGALGKLKKVSPMATKAQGLISPIERNPGRMSSVIERSRR